MRVVADRGAAPHCLSFKRGEGRGANRPQGVAMTVWQGWARLPGREWTLVACCPGEKERVRMEVSKWLVGRNGARGVVVPEGVSPDSPHAESVREWRGAHIVRPAGRGPPGG
jgi:hypothetical protein